MAAEALTAEQHAERIIAAAATLQADIDAATAAGLAVTVDIAELVQLGERAPRPILAVAVSRPLARSAFVRRQP